MSHTANVNARAQLSTMIRSWDQEPDSSIDKELFRDILDEVLFHGDHRYSHYRPHSNEGMFPARLLQWLQNLTSSIDQQQLLQLLRHVAFIDDRELEALYIDAYRRIIVPWSMRLTGRTILNLLEYTSEHSLRATVTTYALASITLSFSTTQFIQINELVGLPDPVVLGDTVDEAIARVSSTQIFSRAKACIVMEDFVGTGDQAGTILQAIRKQLPPTIPIIFVPLVCLEIGRDTLESILLDSVQVAPVLIIPKRTCILPDPQPDEPLEFQGFRQIIRNTSKIVRKCFNSFDVPPSSPYGYKNSGALYVSSHNTPNNTVPLLHHKAPRWEALFRRHHHQRAVTSVKKSDIYQDGLR
jgi:hypothetical protein